MSQNFGAWPTSAAADDEVRTIFVTGFPTDTKERELQNLLRWWPGYEACQLTLKNDQPMGFALFSSASMAVAARDALQNLVFDLETNSTLRAEMAKKNLFMKRGVIPPSSAVSPTPGYETNKRMRTADPAPPAYMQPPMGGYMSASPYDAYSYSSPYGAPAASPMPPPMPVHAPMGSYSPMSSAPPLQRHRAPYASPGNMKDNPPCSTLFVGNLADHVSEGELHGIFGSLPGYRQMKMLHQAHGIVCFIEYADIESAKSAHACTQGVVLNSSDRGGLRVQFAKNPLGRKRDGTFHPSSAAAAAGDSQGATEPPGAGVEEGVPGLNGEEGTQ